MLLPAAAALLTSVIAAPPALGGRRTATVTVTVTAGKPTESAFRLSRTSVPVGTVVFKVVNRGKLAHAFAIAGKRTPLLAPGKSASLTVVFATAGTYVYSSSLHARSHYPVLDVVARTAPATPTPTTTTTAQPPGYSATSVGAPCTSPAPSTVNVQIFDFGFTLSQSTVPCGTVTFQIVNTGAILHNFDIQSPSASGVAAFNGGLNLLGGETQSQTVNFTRSGTYQYQCDLHWIQGQMIGTLTVTQ